MLLKLVLKILIAAACAVLPLSSRADTVITNLTLETMRAALTNGGLITFTNVATNAALVLSTNSLVVSKDTTIDGSGLAVIFSGNSSTNMGAPRSRVFFVTNNVTLTLANLIVLNGRETNGAGIYVSPGATLNTVNCILSGNVAFGANGRNGSNASSNGGDGGNGAAGTNGIGGAIYNLGTVNIANSLISSNTASGGDGGNGGRGGDDSSFGGEGGNGASGAIGWGGGIYNGTNAALFIFDSTLTNNFALGGFGGLAGLGGTAPFPGEPGRGGAGAAGAGGAIYNLGTVVMAGSTVVTNAALGGDTAHAGVDQNGLPGGVGDGGGIFNGGILTIVNSTFTQNFAEGGKGGNVFSGNFVDGGNGGSGRGGSIFTTNSLTIQSSTLATNRASGGPAGTSPLAGHSGSAGASLGGNIYRLSGQATLNNTILAKGASGANYVSATVFNVAGAYNLSSDATPANFPTADKNKNILLRPLANNGGRTATMALMENSPAIDTANPNLCEPADQRGVPRPYGTRCDIGAYERVPAFVISGRLLDGTNGVGQIIVVAAGNVTNGAVSLTNGNYVITNLPPGNYTVKAGPSFTPAQQVINLSAHATNINFNYIGAKLSFPFYSANEGVFEFLFSGKANQPYEVQRSPNLVDWVKHFTITNAGNGLFIVGATGATNFQQMFFRVFQP